MGRQVDGERRTTGREQRKQTDEGNIRLRQNCVTVTAVLHSSVRLSADLTHNTNVLRICFPDLLLNSPFDIQQVVRGRACICAERHEEVNQPLCLRLNLRIAAQRSCNRARLPLRLTAHYHRTAPKDPPPHPSPAPHPSQHDLTPEMELRDHDAYLRTYPPP